MVRFSGTDKNPAPATFAVLACPLERATTGAAGRGVLCKE
jgi:hypothetical protein